MALTRAQFNMIKGKGYLLAEVAALTDYEDGQHIYVSGRTAAGDGYEGMFVFNETDLSTEVTADTLQGIHIAPDADDTGGSGAWVREGFGTGLALIPEMFGAVDGTDDEIQINAAIDLLADLLGCGTVKLSEKVYHIDSASIIVRSGIRLIGSGQSWTAGNYIDHNYDGPCVQINGGDGLDWELKDLLIKGDTSLSSQDGVYLVDSAGDVPRQSKIDGVMCFECGRDGFRFDAFSYITMIQCYGVDCINNGLTLSNASATALHEFAFIQDSVFGGAGGSGVQIARADRIYLHNCDINSNTIGIEILGNSYAIEGRGINLEYNDTGIEISADAGPITRCSFPGLKVIMTGASASELAVYIHRSGGYQVQGVDLSNLYIVKGGATAPTYSVHVEWSAFIDLSNFYDASGGAFYFLYNTSICNIYNADSVIQPAATSTEAISPYSALVQFWNDGAAVTLADGVSGKERITFVMKTGSISCTLTVANHATSSPEVFTFAASGATLILEYTGSEWVTIYNDGVTT